MKRTFSEMLKEIASSGDTAMVKEFARRYKTCSRRDMRKPAQIAEHAFANMERIDEQESMYGMYLDSQLRILGFRQITMGLVDRSLVHAREVFRPAIELNASAIVLVHNHPSGNVTPSWADKEVTKTIKQASEIMGIKLIDHIIVGGKLGDDCEVRFHSFVENAELASN